MFFLLFLCFISEALTVSVPFIKKCKIDDNKCIVRTANDAIPLLLPGIPELDIPPMDPLFIDEVKSEQSGLKLTIRNNTIKGLKTCVMSNFKSEILTKNMHTLTIKCSNIILEGQYKIDGQILVLPIRGQGKATVDMHDVVLKIVGTLSTVTGSDGKPHWNVDNWKQNFKVLTKATLNFENLFNGNRILADPVAEFLNSNWRDVFEETGYPIVQAIVTKFIDIAKIIYKTAAIDELSFP